MSQPEARSSAGPPRSASRSPRRPFEVAAVVSEPGHPRSSARTASTAPRELHGRASAGEVAAALSELPELLGDVTGEHRAACSEPAATAAAAIAAELVTTAFEVAAAACREHHDQRRRHRDQRDRQDSAADARIPADL